MLHQNIGDTLELDQKAPCHHGSCMLDIEAQNLGDVPFCAKVGATKSPGQLGPKAGHRFMAGYCNDRT